MVQFAFGLRTCFASFANPWRSSRLSSFLPKLALTQTRQELPRRTQSQSNAPNETKLSRICPWLMKSPPDSVTIVHTAASLCLQSESAFQHRVTRGSLHFSLAAPTSSRFRRRPLAQDGYALAGSARPLYREHSAAPLGPLCHRQTYRCSKRGIFPASLRCTRQRGDPASPSSQVLRWRLKQLGRGQGTRLSDLRLSG